jgi:hypothetical protein
MLGNLDFKLARQQRYRADPAHVRAYRIGATRRVFFLLVVLYLGTLDRWLDLDAFADRDE